MEESKKFARWLIIHTEDAGFTLGPCRRYKNKVLNVDELYEIFKFNTWLTNHTEEVSFTLGALREYKGKVFNVDELYEIFKLVCD